MEFDVTRRDGRLVTFNAEEVERAAAQIEEIERGIFLFRNTMKVKISSKVIPMSCLKIQKGKMLIGIKESEE